VRNDLVEQKVLFSKQECEYLKTLFNDIDFKKSKINDKNSNIQYSDERTSYDIFLNFEIDTKNILINKLKEIGIKGEFYYFSVLRYDIGQEFKKHTDNIGSPNTPHSKRFKTVIIQLSNENEYEGGDLIIYNNDETITASKQIGNTIIFHSSLEHEVTKLTKGRRYCIVFWLEKKNIDIKHYFI
jgi:hypothetical protein